MTVIEFFDHKPIDNILSTLTVDFSKIIFIGENKRLEKFGPIYQKFIENRGIKAEVCYRTINRNNMQDVVAVLSEIVESEDECFFDLTGGDDLALVAMGIVFERYPNKKIQMERINTNTLKVTDCDNDNRIISVKPIDITIEEYIALHGGKVTYTDEGNNGFIGTYKWNFTDDFIKDIDFMWELCKEDPKKWNQSVGVIIKMTELSSSSNGLLISAELFELKECIVKQNAKYFSIEELLQKLFKKGIILDLEINNNFLQFSFKNHQVKKCLTKAGTVLELKVTTTAMRATANNGSKVYSNVMNGVCIDWDGYEQDGEDTFNEIDVIMLSGLTPVFVSCKNGHIEDDELYKLESVATRFGGEKVKKVLIATYFGRQGESKKHFIKRAEDMKIKFIEQVHTLKNTDFEKLIRWFAAN